MLKAIDHCHFHGFVHRDIKLENILIDKEFKIRLVDFGFAGPVKGREDSGLLKTKLGTHGHRAPEMYSRKSYEGKGIDIFALGVSLFMMVYRSYPFINT